MIRPTALALAPATRADCIGAPRPCMRFSCRHHLAVDVDEDGRIFIVGGSMLPADPSFADLEDFVDELFARVRKSGSCVLDLVERTNGMTLAEIGERIGVTRERVRQIETKALARLSPRVRHYLGKRVTADDVIGAQPIPPLE